MSRLTIDKDDSFAELGRQVRVLPLVSSAHADSLQLLPNLPKTVDPNTVTLSNAPTGGDAKRLVDIASFKVGQIGLK